MTAPPKKAFVLAAGFGGRMRPLTDTCPKPLLTVGGVTMLDRALDALAAAGVEEAVVNTHYLGEQIARHLQNRAQPAITLSPEAEILDTGGGVKNALKFFDDAPFYVLNADIVWEDPAGGNALTDLARAWNDATMDILLLLHPVAETGDYFLKGDTGSPVFHGGGAGGNAVFTGLRIVHPRVFDGVTQTRFSFLDLFHAAEKKGRLAGLRHRGAWHHVGTPAALAATDALFRQRGAKAPVP